MITISKYLTSLHSTKLWSRSSILQSISVRDLKDSCMASSFVSKHFQYDNFWWYMIVIMEHYWLWSQLSWISSYVYYHKVQLRFVIVVKCFYIYFMSQCLNFELSHNMWSDSDCKQNDLWHLLAEAWPPKQFTISIAEGSNLVWRRDEYHRHSFIH